MASGLAATIIESPLTLQSRYLSPNSTTSNDLGLPPSHLAACRVASIATEGNAAANRADPLDLSAQNVSPGPIPTGFTPRGIVALTFTVLAAVVGCAVLAWYGVVGGEEWSGKGGFWR